MTNSSRLAGTLASLALLIGAIALAIAVFTPAEAPAAETASSVSATTGMRYVCPPCGAPCDTLSFGAPGVCPVCGMTLVDASTIEAPKTAPKKVAFLVFPGCEVIDFAGPYEMFGAANCDVYTVGATKEPVTTAMGLTVVPRYSFADAPQPDVLVIPGGAVKATSDDATTLRYIEDVTTHTTSTMSVCNGAFILANTGLLDGLSATTTYGNIPRLASEHPKIKVVNDQRYVDNGRLITTAGLSAGMDGALHVIARLFGTGYAEQVALGEEYAWSPNGNFVRAALADHQIPQVDFDHLGDWHLVRTEGDRNRWNIDVAGQSPLAADELMARIEAQLAKGGWRRRSAITAEAKTQTIVWHFTGTDGRPWRATVRLVSAGPGAHDYTAALTVTRTS